MLPHFNNYDECRIFITVLKIAAPLCLLLAQALQANLAGLHYHDLMNLGIDGKRQTNKREPGASFQL